MTVLRRLQVVAIDKVSSIAFADAMFDALAEGRVVMPVPLDGPLDFPGLEIQRRVEVAAGGGWFDRRLTLRNSPDPAQVTLTSGTTGLPKPILLSHRALADTGERLIGVMGLDDSVREYVGVPVSYSFGFGRLRAVAASGGRAFLPPDGFRVAELASMLERGEVNALSAVPTLLRLLIGPGDLLHGAGRQLRWLEIGSQAMSADEKDAVRTLFPNARIVQHYGLTEASRTTFLTIDAAAPMQVLASVGQPTGSVEVRTTADGLIEIRGPHVADGIVTARGIEPLTDADGWLTTRDLGHSEDGLLFYDGRADHLINVGGIKIPAESFEASLLAELGDGGGDIAVAAGADRLRGELVVIAHRAADEARLADASRKVAQSFAIGEGFALHAVDAVPRTETGKVQRSRITEAFNARTAPAPASPRDFARDDVQGMFVAQFGPAALEASQSFMALGGDSLSYVSLAAGLARIVPDLPDDWQRKSIAELAALAHDPAAAPARLRKARTLPPNLNSLRGLACLLVVAFHVVGLNAGSGMRLPDGSMWREVGLALSYVRLPLFLAMAGFLYGAMPAIGESFGTFAGRKIKQFVPPILFVTFVTWGLRRVVYGAPDELLYSLGQGYLHLWFLYALLWMFLLAAALERVALGSWKIWLGVIVAAPLVKLTVPITTFLSLNIAVRILPFFAIGVLFYRAPRLMHDVRFVTWMSAAAGALLALQCAVIFSVLNLQPSLALDLLTGAAAAVVLINGFPVVRPLALIAPYTYTIYLWHPVANAGLRFVLQRVGLGADMWVLFLGGLAAGIGCPVLLHRVMLHFPRLSLPVIGR